MLITLIVFYTENPESHFQEEEVLPVLVSGDKRTKLSNKILQAKYELIHFPLGREHKDLPKFKVPRSLKEYYSEPGSGKSGISLDLTPATPNTTFLPPPVKLKTECCDKYLKGKRCGRCPCFDLQ